MAEKKRPRRFWGILGIAAGAAALLYYIAAGSLAGFGVSVLWVWAAAGSVLLLLGIADLVTLTACRPVRRIILGLRYTILLCVVWFSVTQFCVLSAMTAEPPVDVDYLLIAGAMVYGEEPSPALLARLDTAYAYLTAHPDTVAILCGGRGAGEDITEAECMRRILTAYGVDPARLILEDNSSTTAENMQNARRLVADTEATAAVVTSNFHVFRSVRIAEKCGWRMVYGLAAPFGGIMLPHYMAREFLTISVDTLRGNM